MRERSEIKKRKIPNEKPGLEKEHKKVDKRKPKIKRKKYLSNRTIRIITKHLIKTKTRIPPLEVSEFPKHLACYFFFSPDPHLDIQGYEYGVEK
ncbi:MAG: hypothetical protein WCC74_02335 [Minisyncoccia bacterium]